MGFQPISEVTDILTARSKKCIASGNAMIKVGEALYMPGQQRTDKVPDLLPPPASSQQRDVEHPIDKYVQVDMQPIPDQTAECLFRRWASSQLEALIVQGTSSQFDLQCSSFSGPEFGEHRQHEGFQASVPYRRAPHRTEGDSGFQPTILRNTAVLQKGDLMVLPYGGANSAFIWKDDASTHVRKHKDSGLPAKNMKIM